VFGVIVASAPGIDDFDIGVVQVLGQPGDADEEVSVRIIEFSHGDVTPCK
jgi:hypothetical protein